MIQTFNEKENRFYIETRVTVSETNTHIENSYNMPSCYMEVFLLEIRKKNPNPNLAINKLDIDDMITEWKAHNILYYLGIQRKRTGSVDLNINEPWYRKLGYKILSIFYV